jgi:hypothetical protein
MYVYVLCRHRRRPAQAGPRARWPVVCLHKCCTFAEGYGVLFWRMITCCAAVQALTPTCAGWATSAPVWLLACAIVAYLLTIWCIFCGTCCAGTDADLRRLGHKRAGELLMSKFNMPKEEVDALPRWDRIDAIRRWVQVLKLLADACCGAGVRDPACAAVVIADFRDVCDQNFQCQHLTSPAAMCLRMCAQGCARPSLGCCGQCWLLPTTAVFAQLGGRSATVASSASK